ncbi:hypothetical protein GQF42_42435 [Streptomyces broussonetiae]|uniref:Uncharacterized protein n=1 Tax=Streptomyces broussonetiae TaxID=2686304 RepID=A0A6I6NC71_9ACTN|nr:hypothetical protein [Streptomyces broussonetiae]QHA09004.1 hypothetical protein GQF42_42435 [Streptomyces broussonetiae]
MPLTTRRRPKPVTLAHDAAAATGTQARRRLGLRLACGLTRMRNAHRW